MHGGIRPRRLEGARPHRSRRVELSCAAGGWRARMKPPERRGNIFIVSSGEARPIAEAVKQHFDQDWDVDIWCENIFKINRSYLETLLNRASYYDFCIAVFAADDAANIRGQAVRIPRDNVILE